ncbi:MAG: DNA/RNA nuclease SfsA [Desulfurococcaceae archaeon]
MNTTNLKPLIKLSDLVECRILKRVSRFVVLVDIAGRASTAYLNNTGRLLDYLVPGKVGYCIETRSGRLKYRLVGVGDGEYAALVDTRLQENSFIALYEMGLLSWLNGYRLFKRNYELEGVVVDFAFKRNDELLLTELKSAVMKLGGGAAGYPDAPTIRGRNQILKLADFAKRGNKAFVVFIAAIPHATVFRLYCNADKQIKYVIDYALNSGVNFKSVNVFLDVGSSSVVSGNLELPVDLSCSSE